MGDAPRSRRSWTGEAGLTSRQKGNTPGRSARSGVLRSSCRSSSRRARAVKWSCHTQACTPRHRHANPLTRGCFQKNAHGLEGERIDTVSGIGDDTLDARASRPFARRRRVEARRETSGAGVLRSGRARAIPTTPAFSPRTRGTRPASDVPSRAFAAERLTERHGRGRHGRRRPDGHATRHRDAPGHSGTTAFLSRPALFPPPPSSSPPAPMLTRSPPSFPLFFSRA